MNTLLRLGAPLSLLIACAIPSSGQDPSPGTTGGRQPLQVGAHVFHRRVLENGLRAAVVRDEEETLSVFITIGVGNRQEDENTTGLAHLVEHALFSGTPTTGTDEHEKAVVSWGGESNAFTREDYTVYYDHHVPPARLGELLAMEADRLSNLGFFEEAVLHERHRLEVEEKHTYQPSDGRAEELEAAAFRVHPYRAGLRDAEGLTRGPGLSVEVIEKFYRRYYHPNNMSVVVVGPVDAQEALAAIETAFGGIPRGPALPTISTEPWFTARTEHLASTLPRDRYDLVWLIPAMGDPARPALDVLSEWVGRRQLADGRPVQVSVGGRVDRDLFRLSASGEGALEELRAIAAEILVTPPDAQELAEVKGEMGDEFENLPLRARPYFSLAGTFGVYEALGHPELLVRHREAIGAVSAEAVHEAAVRFLGLERCVTVVFEGTGAEVQPLPEDITELRSAATEAAEVGDYPRAIEAYTRMLAGKPNKMNTVIYLATRGQIHLERKDYDSAIADFEEALDVIDYPAVRELLDETLARKAAAMRGKFVDESTEEGAGSGGQPEEPRH